MAEIKVEYNLGVDDIAVFYLYSRVDSPKAKRGFKMLSIIAPLLAILAGLYGVFSWPRKMEAIPALILSVFMIYGAIFYKNTIKKQIPKWVNWRYGKGKNDITGNHKFTITEDKIIDVNEKGESATRWRMIEELILTDKYLFFILRASMGFHIIPKNAFSNDADFEQFASTAKNYHQAALIKRNAF